MIHSSSILSTLKVSVLALVVCIGSNLTAFTGLPLIKPSGAAYFAELSGETLLPTDPGGPRGLVFHEPSSGTPQIWSNTTNRYIDHPFNPNPVYTYIDSADFYDFTNRRSNGSRISSVTPLAQASHHNFENTDLPINDGEEIFISLYGFYLNSYQGQFDINDYYVDDLGNGNYQETRIYRDGILELYLFDSDGGVYQQIGTSSYYGATLTMRIYWPASGNFDDATVDITVEGDYEYYTDTGSLDVTDNSTIQSDLTIPLATNYTFQISATEIASSFLSGTPADYELREFENTAYMQLENAAIGGGSPPYFYEIVDQRLFADLENFIPFIDIDPDGSSSQNKVSIKISPVPNNYYFAEDDNFISITPTASEVGTTFSIELIAEDASGLTSNVEFSATVAGSIIPTSGNTPIIASGSPASYTEDAGEIVIDPSLTISDSDFDFANPDATQTQGSLVVQITSGSDAEDAIYLSPPLTSPGIGLEISGLDVTYDGVKVAELNEGSARGGDPLIFTFEAGLDSFSSLTDTIVTEIANAVYFDSTEDDPATSKVITFTVTDSTGLSNSLSQTHTVNATNDKPEFGTLTAQTVNEKSLLSYLVPATDPDSPNLKYSIDSTTRQSGMAINASTGEFTWTPDENQGPGTYTVTVFVEDDSAPPLQDSESFQITVNEVNLAPAPVNDAFAANENEPITILTSNLIANDSDPDGNTFSINSVDGVSNLGASIDVDLTNDRIIYNTDTLPANSELGEGSSVSDSFQYTVIDSQGLQRTATVVVTVNGVDDLPVIDAFLPFEVFESVEFETRVSTSDLDSEGLPTLALGADSADFAELLFIESEGNEAFYSLTLKPDINDLGARSITLIATPSDRGESTTRTFTFNVEDSLQRPFSTGFAEFLLEEGDTSLEIPLFDYFDDPDGSDSQLSFELVQNTNPFIYESMVFEESTGILSLTFNAEIIGNIDLTLRATDIDNLSATLDIFISLRDELFFEARAAAGTSQKRIDLRSRTNAENVLSLTLSPVTTTSESFPSYIWNSETMILELTPTETPSRSLFSVTYHLNNEALVERLLPVTYSVGEVFADDDSIGQSWFYSDAIGLYFRHGDWAFHPTLGWMYFDITLDEGVYFFSELNGWFYTSKTTFPYIFDVNAQTWKYAYITEDSAFVYDFETQAYVVWKK